MLSCTVLQSGCWVRDATWLISVVSAAAPSPLISLGSSFFFLFPCLAPTVSEMIALLKDPLGLHCFLLGKYFFPAQSLRGNLFDFSSLLAFVLYIMSLAFSLLVC